MAVVLGPDDLVSSHFTLTGAPPLEAPRFGFAERVAAAAAAGFAGIGLLGDDYAAMRAQGLTDAELAAILDDHAIVLAEVEFLFDWSAGPDDTGRLANALRLEEQVWAMADAFGPRVVSVGELAGPEVIGPLDALTDRFAALCDRAAEHGLLVALEFMPWTGIPDVASASSLVRSSGRANAGINLDAWHYFRGTADADALRAVAERVFMIQLDDAEPEVVGELFEDTTLRRRYPGTAGFDLVGLLRLLDDAGASAPISVELMSPEHQALPVAEAARRAHDSTRQVLTRARGAR